ncbi:MAG TPA: c-type cytochrome biogenesis protein CcmI [Acetobacteraceae bacterium]|nr:c-type cytochrome biogenesis protein CcmI [Acetobacteraceae bacterium]
MISLWLAVIALMVVALAPMALALRRGTGARGRQEAALALHRAQLAELDRDLADGRIGAAEHATAVLEVQRRLLAAAALADPALAPASRSALWTTLALVPLAAVLLYLVGGSPGLPAMPLQQRLQAAEQRVRKEDKLVAELREVLGRLDPRSDRARQGYVLLGNAEARLGNMNGAAAAWQHALTVRFDPMLAAEAAEALTEANGHVTEAAAALFRRALTEAPPDAPWRPMAERRLAGG